MLDKGLHMMEEGRFVENERVHGWPERLYVTGIVLVWGSYLLGLLAFAVYAIGN